MRCALQNWRLRRRAARTGFLLALVLTTRIPSQASARRTILRESPLVVSERGIGHREFRSAQLMFLTRGAAQQAGLKVEQYRASCGCGPAILFCRVGETAVRVFGRVDQQRAPNRWTRYHEVERNLSAPGEVHAGTTIAVVGLPLDTSAKRPPLNDMRQTYGFHGTRPGEPIPREQTFSLPNQHFTSGPKESRRQLRTEGRLAILREVLYPDATGEPVVDLLIEVPELQGIRPLVRSTLEQSAPGGTVNPDTWDVPRFHFRVDSPPPRKP